MTGEIVYFGVSILHVCGDFMKQWAVACLTLAQIEGHDIDGGLSGRVLIGPVCGSGAQII